MLNNTQVEQQRQRFESFINSVNLVKLGERYLYMMGNDSEDGRFTPYCYILRVLSLVAKVGGCYYYPNRNEFYNEITKRKAVEAYLQHLDRQRKTAISEKGRC